MAKIEKVKEQNRCKNCVHLRWGKEQGWDYCSVNNCGIAWGSNEICELHERSELKDPRNWDRDFWVNVELKHSEIKKILERVDGLPLDLIEKFKKALKESRS